MFYLKFSLVLFLCFYCRINAELLYSTAWILCNVANVEKLTTSFDTQLLQQQVEGIHFTVKFIIMRSILEVLLVYLKVYKCDHPK